jgi:hypothetical protein
VFFTKQKILTLFVKYVVQYSKNHRLTKMTKKEAIKLLGGKYQADLGRALGKSRAAICEWPEVLNKDQERMVLGEAYLQNRLALKLQFNEMVERYGSDQLKEHLKNE